MDIDSKEDLAYQAAHQAMLTKTRYNLLEARAVRLGRQGGVSWDKLGGWLTVPGETLRRRYGSAGASPETKLCVHGWSGEVVGEPCRHPMQEPES